jgi:hypothetical protein
MGFLTQQLWIDRLLRVDDAKYRFIKTMLPQDLMVASRRDLEQFIERVALREDYEVGRSFVLPSTFRGSPEEMRTLREHMIRSVYVSVIHGDRPIVTVKQLL